MNLNIDRPVPPAGKHASDRRFGLTIILIGSFLASAGFSLPLSVWMGDEYDERGWLLVCFVLYQALALWSTWWQLDQSGLVQGRRINPGDLIFVAVAFGAGVCMGMQIVVDFSASLLIGVVTGSATRLGLHLVNAGHDIAGFADQRLRELGYAPGWPPGRKYRA